LQLRLGRIEPVLLRIDPLLSNPISLTSDEFAFVRDGLLDRRLGKKPCAG
jgi:hypothetical protein